MSARLPDITTEIGRVELYNKSLQSYQRRITELEAALRPFARAYERLLDNEPSPDVIINTKNHDEWGVVSYGKRPAIVQWSDLYRAANLLRETPHA